MREKKLSLLGSTGTIGINTLDIVRKNPDFLKVISLAAHSNMEKLSEQIIEFLPEAVSVGSEQKRNELLEILKSRTSEMKASYPDILIGEKGACILAGSESSDTVVSAIVGAAALVPTLAAVRAGKRVALANKESLVIAGDLLLEEAQKYSAEIIPVDSEHSAIFQCLEAEHSKKSLSRIKLTASGGPFWSRPIEDFSKITVKEALNHPRWKMGPKITIDSATMMNKGLELIEATKLFHLPASKIDILVHPQSIVHSLVEFTDGALLAHLGVADMKGPISYAIFYPDRAEGVMDSLDLTKVGPLEFHTPDYEKFPALRLALESAEAAGFMPTILNASNEVVVDAFLQERLKFNEIGKLIGKVLDAGQSRNFGNPKDLDCLLESDLWTRKFTSEMIPA